jgi:transposase-like protein
MTISFARHQFPPEIIRHAVRLYVRFTLSYRDVEDMLAERGLDVSYETVRRWVLNFGPLFARDVDLLSNLRLGPIWVKSGAEMGLPQTLWCPA